MNLATLTTLLVMLSGLAAPIAQTMGRQAGGWKILLCAAVSLLYSIAAGYAAACVSYRLLNTPRGHGRFAPWVTAAYLLFPLPAAALTALGGYLWSSTLLR